MKKLFTLLSIVACITAKAQTIPNGGFETWATNTESSQHYTLPQNWISADLWVGSVIPTYTATTVAKSTQSHSGQYAALLTTLLDANDTVAGMLYSCNSLADYNASYGQHYGFSCTNRPATLQGYYKLTSVGGDLGVVQLTLSKWNTGTNSHDILFQNYYFGLTASGSYTPFNFPITYAYNETPDSASIMITIGHSGSQMHNGTQLFIDDLTFTGNVALGIEQVTKNNENINVYPNPASGQISIERESEEPENITVRDLNGKIVYTGIIRGMGINTIDLSTGQNGVYLLQTGSVKFKLMIAK